MEIVATAMTGESLYVHEGFALIGFGLGMTGFLELRGNSNLDGLCECRSETDGKPFPELVFARLLVFGFPRKARSRDNRGTKFLRLAGWVHSGCFASRPQ